MSEPTADSRLVADLVSFRLNGCDVQMSVTDDMPLLYALRNDLACRSVRFGCGDGVCGACTVVVDGRAMKSCDMPVSAAQGSQVTTMEGHADDPLLARLVEAVVDHQAAQCGYCVPGIVLAARVLIAAEPGAGRARIAQALDRNLCRCGAHGRLLDALCDVSAKEAAQ